METIFENKTVLTKDYYTEYYRYICFKRPVIIFINIIILLNFIVTMSSIVYPKLNILDVNTIISNIGIILITISIELYIFFRDRNLAYDRDLETNKGNLVEINISISHDNIQISSSLGKKIDFEFKNIRKLIKTKNYYILLSKTDLSITLKKDRFKKGSALEFEEFLREKIG